MNPAKLIEWQQIPAVLKSFDVVFIISLEQVVVELIRRRQRAALDLRQMVQDLDGVCVPFEYCV